MLRVALYVRVSSQEQKLHGMSVDTQIDALQEYAREHGYKVVGLYNDAGLSGRKSYTKRPAILSLLEDCKAGKIDVILFTKLDRWFRNISDYYKIQDQLDKCHVRWKTIWEDYDTTTSNGIFYTNIALSVAQNEADRTGDRIKAVNKYLVDQGKWVGSACTGYKVVKMQLIKDESVSEAVRAGFDAYLATFSVTEMHKAMINKGMHVARETCFRMIKNPVYTGHAKNHVFEPYITQEEFDLIQRHNSKNPIIRAPRGKKVYLFQGLVYCAECGSLCRSQTRTMYTKSKTRNVNYHQYYQCGKGKEYCCPNRRTVGERVIERKLLSDIESVMDRYLIEMESEQAQVDNYEEMKSRYEKQIKRIGDRYEMDEITHEEYKEKVADIRSKISALVPVERREIKKLPEGWRDIYDSLDASHRKQFWIQAISSITIDSEANITINL